MTEPTPTDTWAALALRECLARCALMAVTEWIRLANELKRQR